MKSSISAFASHATPVNKDAAMVLQGAPKDDKLWEINKDDEAGWSKNVDYKKEWEKAISKMVSMSKTIKQLQKQNKILTDQYNALHKRSVKFNAFK